MIGFRLKEELVKPAKYFNHDDAWEDLPSAFFIDSDGDLLMITAEGWISNNLSYQDHDFAAYPVFPVNIEEIEFYKEQ